MKSSGRLLFIDTQPLSHLQPFHTSFHTLPRIQPHGGSFQPLSVTTFLVPSSTANTDPAHSDPGGVATLGRRKRLSSSGRLTEVGSDHIYAIVQPKDKRISTASSSAASSSQPPPNLLDLIPPPPTYPPSPPLLSRRKQLSCTTVASDATEETSRLLVRDECDGLQQENGYAKLKRNKNKVGADLIPVQEKDFKGFGSPACDDRNYS